MKSDLLIDELRRRHASGPKAIRYWSARAATSPSVIRVFTSETKAGLLKALTQIPVEEIAKLKTGAAFERWFETQLHKISAAIAGKNRRNSRVQPGLTWGHSAKVLAIYLRSVVLHSRLFDDRTVARVRPWLFVPVDSVVMKCLKKCGVRTPFRKIREIATRADFYLVQNLLAESCEPGISRIMFDDAWADRDEPVA